LPTALALASAEETLILRLGAGSAVGYSVSVTNTESAGSGGKVMSTYATKTPVEVSVVSVKGRSAQVRVKAGPVFARGRSVGRAKMGDATVGGDAGLRPAILLWVSLPPAGVRQGQTWVGGLNGPAPLPAGLQAKYRFASVSASGGKRFACVDMTVTAKAACTVRGRGKLYLRLSDGVIDHGNARFDIAYERPDPKAPSRMVVNSRVVLACRIEQ
jgi:hypothetical protein